MKGLYTKEFCTIMQVNSDYSRMSSNRVDEIMNFEKGANFERIGIAYCITFGYEAELLKKYFSKYFDVHMVDCKYGRLFKKEILSGESNQVLCNPAGQADFLNKQHTDLNISMGLCVGHDMIFSKNQMLW